MPVQAHDDEREHELVHNAGAQEVDVHDVPAHAVLRTPDRPCSVQASSQQHRFLCSQNFVPAQAVDRALVMRMMPRKGAAASIGQRKGQHKKGQISV